MTAISASLPATSNSNLITTTAAPAKLSSATSADLAQTAVSLASESSVVILLGTGGADSAVYDASGLLDSLKQAGTASGVAGKTQAAPQSLDQGLAGALSATPAATPLYSVAGGLVASGPDVTSNFASILKTDSGVAATVIDDSFNQGIVGTISTFA
jgi:hypothetical protein